MQDDDHQNVFDVLDLCGDIDCEVLNTDSLGCFQFQDVASYLDMRDDIKDRIEELPSTADSEDTETHQGNEDEQNSENYQQISEQSTAAFFCQPFNGEIQFSQEKKTLRDIAYKGHHHETQNIGKHFKTATSSYLTLLIQTKSLEFLEAQAALRFSETNGGIDDFNKLFQIQGIRLKCREYFQSEAFMKYILGSGKMDMKSKLAMIKYVEKFRQITFGQAEQWKIVKT